MAMEPPVIAVPLGSCEQHGPHLPLDTDLRIAEAIAEGLARSAANVLVGPALTVTASGEHAGFPGTLSIGERTTEALIVELVRSADWSGGVVLVNAHGGNVGAVTAAVATLHTEGRRVLAWSPRIPGGDAHAGRTETSLMLAIAADCVRLDVAAPGCTTPIGELLPQLRRGGVRSVSANGVLGDPAGASAADGQQLLDELVTDLAGAVEEWRG
jgi:creatinine amidohydrolase